MFELSYLEASPETIEGIAYGAGRIATRCFDLIVEPMETVSQNVDLEVEYKYLDKEGYPSKVGDYAHSLSSNIYKDIQLYPNLSPFDTLMIRQCWKFAESIETFSATITKVEFTDMHDVFKSPSEYELSTIIERVEWTKTPSSWSPNSGSCTHHTQSTRGVLAFENLNIVKQSRIRLEAFHNMYGCSNDGEIEVYLKNDSLETRTIHVTTTSYLLGEPSFTNSSGRSGHYQMTVEGGSKAILAFYHGRYDPYPVSFDVELSVRVTKGGIK